jgi:hypothetical protein
MRVMVLGFCLVACGTDSATNERDANPLQPTTDANVADAGVVVGSGPGHITFHFGGHVYRIRAEANATPEDLGTDDTLDLSPDGMWMVVTTTRFGCSGYACLALVPSSNPSGGAAVSGGAIHPSADSVVASGGNWIAFTGPGTHSMDYFAVSRTDAGAAWGAPVELTTASTMAYHHNAAVSADGRSLVMDCGPEPYGVTDSSICEVDADGKNFRVVLRPTDHTGGTTSNELHTPDFAPDGSLVFEADWGGERVWRLPAGGAPFAVAPSYTNDNSPCVLPDGRIASLWLERPGNTQGLHELKVMNADGTGELMLVINQDIVDVGLGCGE